MRRSASHFGEELQDFLDHRLDEARAAHLAGHLESCAQCRRELEALRWVRDEALRPLAEEDLPPGLAGRVAFALDAISAEKRLGRVRRLWAGPNRPALAGTLLAIAAVLLLFVGRGRTPSLPVSVAQDFAAYSDGRLRLAVESRIPATIEEYFVRNGITFSTRVFDLGMMGYDLAGGRVHRGGWGRSPSALFAYRGADGRLLVCQMYEGAVADLPPPAETRQNNGITFHVHRVEGATLVFWQEGGVVCVLASDADPETVIQLAYAKAVGA